MPKDIVRYLALAACAYILVYLGVHMLDDGFGMALPMLATLAGFGALLAREPIGPRACVAAGVVTGIGVAIPLVIRPGAPGALYSASCLIAALLAVLAGLILVRRAKPVDPSA